MKDEITSIELSAADPTRPSSSGSHPSRSLKPRAKGYGIGGGFEKPYRTRPRTMDHQKESYGPIPHAGYYGAGAGNERFERGQAGFRDELAWYSAQYGEMTSGR